MKRAIQSRQGHHKNFLLLSPSPPTKLLLYGLLEQGDGKFSLGSHSLESSLPLGVQVMESSLTSVVHTTEQ